MPDSSYLGELRAYKPKFTVALYKTDVDVVGNHLSGLLLIKKMPDSSIRMLFTNEVGFKFFDFEFSENGYFKVYSIIKKLNKRSVIKTLRKDFELILMRNISGYDVHMVSVNELNYFVLLQEEGRINYVCEGPEFKLLRLERASSKNKVITEAIMQNYVNGIPDTISISHKTFEFNIGLKRLER